MDRSGGLIARRESGQRLVRCDPQVLLGAVQLSDDLEWFSERDARVVSTVPGD